jgi:signal recognition particle subunit SRP54
MFDSLGDRLDGILGRLRGRGRISDADLDGALREIRAALLEADVDIGVARGLVEGIRQRTAGTALAQSLTPGQQVVKAVNEELRRALGGEALKLRFASQPPTVVLLAGLQGSGKTTASAKLARWFRQQGRNPMLVGADLQRPVCRCSASRRIPLPSPRRDWPRHGASGATCSSSTRPGALQ